MNEERITASVKDRVSLNDSRSTLSAFVTYELLV